MPHYLTIAEAARSLPNKPAPSTVWRWCRRGVKARSGQRVYLDHVRLGGKIFVRTGDLDAFGAALAAADREHFAESDAQHDPPRTRTPAQRERDVERAEEELNRAGV